MMSLKQTCAVALMAVVSTLVGPVLAATPYHTEIDALRAKREAGLKQPLGWLSLVGLHWIEEGSHRLGSASDNDIVLAIGPANWGTLHLQEGVIRFQPAPAAAFLLDGKEVKSEVELFADTSGRGSQITFDEGKRGFNLIERDGRVALRVRDSEAASLRRFTGLSYFPTAEDWRINARFEPHPEGTTIEIANVINQLQPMPNPGAVVFERDGVTHRIQAIGNPDGSLFLIFADRTSGKETYGAGRFLGASAPKDGVVEVDFNLAYNPPCAFNDYSTCPLPPPENRLNVAVVAGEKKYLPH